MKYTLVNEIIELKEKRKVLEAELGLSRDDVHIFNRSEKFQIASHKNEIEAYYELEDVTNRLKEDENIMRESLKSGK